MQGGPAGKGSTTRGRQTKLQTPGGSASTKANITASGNTGKPGKNITPKKTASATKKSQGGDFTQTFTRARWICNLCESKRICKNQITVSIPLPINKDISLSHILDQYQ